MDFRFKFCTCGCGNRCDGHFTPGHNQRLRGELVRSHQRAKMVRVLQPVGEPIIATATAVADLLGPEWLAWVAPDIEFERHVQAGTERAMGEAADIIESEWGEGL